jgi:hypothetical protein
MNGISSAFSTATGPLNGMAAGMPGAFHSRKSAIEAVVMEVEKKGRKAIESGANGSNGGGSRKRSRVGLPFDLSHVGGCDLENGTSTRTNGTAQGAGGMRECAAFLGECSYYINSYEVLGCSEHRLMFLWIFTFLDG